MTSGPWSLRLDPWGAEYEGSIQLSDEEETVPVDIRVESAAWAAVRPGPAPRPERIAFVDGVRRVEHRLLIGNGERTVFGLLGSFGVGAVLVDGSARVGHETIGRVAVAGGGLKLDPFVAPVDGRGSLVFEPRSEAENTPVAPVEGLQKAMRTTEAGLAERLSAEVDVVFLDGPLTFLTAAAGGSVVGFVKRQGSPTYEAIDLEREQEVGTGLEGDYDEKFDEAVALVAETRKASISLVQRHLRIGYNRAARIIEKMEEDGIIGPSDGVKPREVLINKT